MTEDIKGLLGRALGAEPPLRLDREEVLRRGQRRVRARRIAASGGVAVSVVAVVVGAAVLSGLGAGEPERDTVAEYGASTVRSLPASADVAPTGPSLPLAASESTTDAHAQTLAKVVASSELITGKFVLAQEGQTAPHFIHWPDGYLLAVDLEDGKGWGTFQVEITQPGPGWALPNCDSGRLTQINCALVRDAGVPMRVSAQKLDAGFQEFEVQAMRPDGTLVVARSSNGTQRGRSRPVPPLDMAALRTIVVLPGLTFS